MATSVNPPPQLKMPKAFLADPEVREYERQRDIILFQLYTRTGGAEDSVTNIDIAESYPWPTNQLLEESIDEIGVDYPAIDNSSDELKIRAVTVNNNYTALDGDFINAKANAQITFPQYPIENSVIIVRNGDGSTIKLIGNGKNMNGESTGVLTRKGTSIEFYYFIESDEWFAR